jgi:hypothetical protein
MGGSRAIGGRRWMRGLALGALLCVTAPACAYADSSRIQTLSYELEGADQELTYALFVPTPLVVLLHARASISWAIRWEAAGRSISR